MGQFVARPYYFAICILISLFLISCTREIHEQQIEVQIIVPNASGSNFMSRNLLSTTQNLSPMIATTPESEPASGFPDSTEAYDWMPLIPTGYVNDMQTGNVYVGGDRPLNCFFIFVSHDDETNDKSCTNTADSGNNFSYSKLSGPFFYNKPMSILVTPSDKMSFRVYGVYVNSELDCRLFNSTNFDRRLMSRPYLYGERNSIDITQVERDASNNPKVSIIKNSNFDADDFIDYCQDSDAAGINGSSSLKADHFQIKVDTGLFGQNALQNSCVPVKIAMQNKSGLNVFYGNNSYDFQISNTPGGSESVKTLYDSAYDCLNSSGGSASFSHSESYETVKWMRVSTLDVNTTRTNTIDFRLNPTYNSIDSNNTLRSLTDKKAQLFNVISTASSHVLAASVPEFFKNNSCIPISVRITNFNWINYSFNTNSFLQLIPTINSSNGLLTLYADPSCNSFQSVNINTSPFIDNNSANFANLTTTEYPSGAGTFSYLKTFYIMPTNFVNGDSFELKLFYNDISITTSGFYYSRFMTGDIANSQMNRLKVSGPSLLTGAVNQCLGPYRLSVADQNGIEHNDVSVTNKQVGFIYDSSAIEIYKAGTFAPCTDASDVIARYSDTTATNRVMNVGGSSNSTFFYVKIQNFNPNLAKREYISVYEIPPSNGQGGYESPTLSAFSWILDLNINSTNQLSVPTYAPTINLMYEFTE